MIQRDMDRAEPRSRIGIVGLGAMGSAMARKLVEAGWTVTGFDIRDECVGELKAIGGHAATSALDVARGSDCVILSLNSVTAVDESVGGAGGLSGAAREGLVVVDTCTLSIEDKLRSKALLEPGGATFIDCVVSGNRNLILDGTLSVFTSGDQSACDRLRPVFSVFSKSQEYMGEFGNASKLKFVLNHLIAVHNAASAEAMALAARSGLDPAHVYRLVTESFASSRVFDARARMMVEGDYTTSRGTYGVARKDAQIISDFARAALVPTPMFHAAWQMHLAGMAAGYTENDTASLFEVYKRFSGAPHIPPQKPRIA